MDGTNRNYKPMPSSEESERVILGSILLDAELMQSAAETLAPGDMYIPTHRAVFGAMLALYAAHRSLEPALIHEQLKASDTAIGVAEITNLSFGVPRVANLDEYIATVKRKAHLRQLIRTCNEIASNAEGDSADDVFTNAQARINDLCIEAETGSTSGEHFVPLRKVIDNEVLAALDDLRNGRSPKIATGFAGIDNAIGGGVAPSDVVLIAADTGKGKSALALQLAYNFASRGTPTAFLAGEMTNKENVLRMLSQLSGITNLNWLSHVSDSEYDHLVAWATHIKETPMLFEHRISDIATLSSHLRSVVRRSGVKVLVIDYIQLFKMEKVDRRKRNERIAEASQEVKRLANDLDIAIVEVAQFNREGAKSLQAGLHDLEGSGQLEKDASLIFILEVDDGEWQADDGRKYSEAKIRVVKGRNVGKSEVPGRFYGRSVQFEFN